MGTRDGAWTGVRCRGSSSLFWVKLAIGIVRIAWDRISQLSKGLRMLG